MFSGSQEGGIAKNIKIIDWLKADLINSVAALFKGMLRSKEDIILDALASLQITCYVLGRRLGINFNRLDLKVEAKLRKGIQEEHEVETWYGDLSGLLNYLTEKKR